MSKWSVVFYLLQGKGLTGCIKEITPMTSSLPSSPPVATKATWPVSFVCTRCEAYLTHPETLAQPVIQERIGIHLSQATMTVNYTSEPSTGKILTNCRQVSDCVRIQYKETHQQPNGIVHQPCKTISNA